jgi:hypothetical protein
LQTSTTMLEVAQKLMRQGNNTEAARLRNEARYKRNESILLMDQAREVEQRSSNVLKFPERNTGRLSYPTPQVAEDLSHSRQRTG